MNPKPIRGSLPEMCPNCNRSLGSTPPGLNASYCQTAGFLRPFSATSARPRPSVPAGVSAVPLIPGTPSGSHPALSGPWLPYIIISSFQNSSPLCPPPSSGLAAGLRALPWQTGRLPLRGAVGGDGCLGCKPTPAGLSPFSPVAPELLQRGC